MPFDEGSLTGNMTAETKWPEGDFRNLYFHPENLRNTLARVERLRDAVPDGMTMPEMVLRHILDHPAVSTVIPGMRKPQARRAEPRRQRRSQAQARGAPGAEEASLGPDGGLRRMARICYNVLFPEAPRSKL